VTHTVVFGWTSEVKDAARRLEAFMEDFERITRKHRLSSIKLARHQKRMRREFDASVTELRRI
jgi:hypothetical protein